MFKKNPKVRMRVINFELNPDKRQKIIIDALTYAASKLWNIGNYERRNWTKESGQKYPDWFEQKRNLKENFWYKNLPSQTAQEVLKMLDESWRSYFELKKTNGIDNPNPPGYKHSNFNIRYLNNGFKVIDRTIRMSVPRNQKAYILQNHNIAIDYLYIRIPKEYKDIEGNIKVIEIIPMPKTKRYVVRIIIELPEVMKKEDNGRYMAIDLGVNNLITCFTSAGKSIIVSGRQLLSLNRYYDKKIGYYQSISYADQVKSGEKHPRDSRRIQKLYEKRRKQVLHLLHAATKHVIDFAEREGITKIIIGDITHIRENKNLGRVNNQKFHKWPYGKITEMLRYKAEDKGIRIEFQEESYTSQCSPDAPEVSMEYAQKSNRKHQGLYVANGKAYNADCVGAYNILKKYLCRNGHKTIPAVEGLDTPEAYRWNSHCFVESSKLAISMAM